MRDIRSCQNCHNLSNEDFKPVANLKNSGLIIYIHDNKSKQKRNYCNGDNIILHNTSNRDIKRFDYVIELCQYRTKCLRCKTLIQRVRNVIDDISIINKNEVIGVCDFCKRSHQKNKCKRCQYIVEKFVHNKAIQNENRDEQFKLWLSKLQKMLISVLEAKVICKHNICLDFEYKSQLYRLLNSLNTPDPMRQPDIDAFPELFDLKGEGADICEKTKILADFVIKYKGIDKNSDVELSFSSSESENECICKYFVKKENVYKPASSTEMVSQEKISLHKISMEKVNVNKSTLMTPSEHQKHYKSKSEKITEQPSTGQKSKVTEVSKKTDKRNIRSNKENVLPEEEIKKKNIAKNAMEKGKKERQNSEYRLMLQMLKEREKEKKLGEQFEKNKKLQHLPSIKKKPVLKPSRRRMKVEKLETQISESVLECNDRHPDVITEIIKGTKIVHLESHIRDIDDGAEKLPLLYKIQADVAGLPNNKQSIALSIANNDNKNKNYGKETHVSDSGVLRYELSNREFIDKGWTKLPSTKIMRRMNIYKMFPASAKFDWFQNYKKQELLFYPSGEKFAEINKTGGGKWFYKNGNVALDAHSAADLNTVKRYVIYSSGEEIVRGKDEPITILACFDYLGNGVVYDCYGNERLKYNQSEGLLKDKKISAPGRWKWHTLNDPPILQQVFLNTYDKSDKNDFLGNFNNDNIKQVNEEMIAIELDNFVKEKANKLMQKFKPFQIKIKILKINNLFSLRIIDQANIFLLFRCDGIYFKINIGMLLKSDEMIDTDIAEVSEVSTPYDKFPPRSPSLVNIQNTLNNVRKRYYSSKNNK